MLEFNQLLNEAAQGKNLHLEHLEDLPFNEGTEGARNAIYFLRELRDMLAGTAQHPIYISTKWDGAPAIIAGTNPENGRFFVATKGAFNVTPKLNYTESDIDRNYPDRALGETLKVALANLSALGIKSVLQGDILFTKQTLHVREIDGVQHLVFQPNTILYAIPLDSALAKNMLKAQIGVVFHTEYRGAKLADMKASFHPELHQLTANPNVWYRDARFIDASGTATFTAHETEEMNLLLNRAAEDYARIDQRTLDYISHTEKIKNQIKQFTNAKVRSGEGVGEPAKHVLALIQWVTQKQNEYILDAKKGDTKTKREIEKNELLKFYRNNYNSLIAIFSLVNAIIHAKEAIIRKLQTVKSIGTFISTDSGLKVTSPEGFVAVNKEGNAVKLVDRLEFSKANFNTTKNWQS